MDKFMDVMISVLALIVTIGFVGLLIGAPIMWLWNAVIPAIFGLTKITFWQAFELSLLCQFLFGAGVKAVD